MLTPQASLTEEDALLSNDPFLVSEALQIQLEKQKQHSAYLADLDFYLEYQPQVIPHSRQFVGSEALLRAKNKSGELLMPYVFLPWLEAAGMMKSIDLWVADQALKQDRLWQQMGLLAPIYINVTGETLADPAAADALIKKLEVAAGRVSIEIVEQDFSASLNNVVDTLTSIQAFGAKVYIDVFAEAHSSLSDLNALPIDGIKVDRSFVLALATESGQKVMADIFNFAETLELSLVIEGLETEGQLAKIPNNVPFSVQGWLFSKALPAEQIPAFIEQFQAN